MALTLQQAIEQTRLNQQASNPLSGLFSGLQAGMINEIQMEQKRQQQEELMRQERLQQEAQRQHQLDMELAKIGVDPTMNRQMSGEAQRVLSDKDGALQKRGIIGSPNKTKIQRLAEANKSAGKKGVFVVDPNTNELVDAGEVGRNDVVFKGEGVSPTVIKAQIDARNKVVDTLLTNNRKMDEIEEAREASKRITGGFAGKIQRGILRNVDPSNEQLKDWQKIKIVLTDAQLMNTARTKGAISDKEMELFANAAANDDIGSVAAMGPVFDRLMNFIEAENKTARETYRMNFGDLTGAENDEQTFDAMQAQPTKEQAIEELRRRGLIQ